MTLYIGHPTKDPLNPLRDVEDYQQFLETLLLNPGAFAAYYFDFEMEPYQIELLQTAAFEQKSLILLPAGHGKSTLISKVLPIFELCRNPNSRGILIMKTSEDVKKYSSSIRNVLEFDKKLIRDFGPFKPDDTTRDPWNSDALNVKKRSILDEHNTLEFFGAGGPVLGHRCDYVIMDDVVTEKNSLTAEQRQKYSQWFKMSVATGPRYMWPRRDDGSIKIPQGVYWPTGVPYERIIVCGTRFNPKDLYWELEHAEKSADVRDYKFLYYDCYQDREQTIPLSPKLMPLERLESERRSLGHLAFNKRYRNIALDESEIAFQQAWVEGGEWKGVEYPGCLDRERSFGEFEDDWEIYVGFDPATSRGTKDSTWPSFVVLGRETPEDPEESPIYHVIDLFRRQMGLEDMISVLLDGDKTRDLPGFWQMYRYDQCMVEANSFCIWVMEHHRIVEATSTLIPVDERVPIIGYENQKRKEDPEMNVRRMEPVVMNGELRIPYKKPSDMNKAAEFIEQMEQFPLGIVDYMMALWFAYFAADRKRKRFKSFYRPGFNGRFKKVA